MTIFAIFAAALALGFVWGMFKKRKPIDALHRAAVFAIIVTLLTLAAFIASSYF